MTNQLVLLENPPAAWRLDDATRATGLRGLAEARATLRAARVRATVRDAGRPAGTVADTAAVRADAA
jgi:hypothetical protein